MWTDRAERQGTGGSRACSVNAGGGGLRMGVDADAENQGEMGEELSRLGPASTRSRGCHYTWQIASLNPDHERMTSFWFHGLSGLLRPRFRNCFQVAFREVHPFLFWVPCVSPRAGGCSPWLRS